MDGDFLTDRITKTKELIVIYETAISELVGGQAQSYTLDTGQSRQTVTKANITELNDSLDKLYNRLAVFEARNGRGGGVTVRPSW